jgi:hypothetical protein
MQMTNIDIEWTEKGCAMKVYGSMKMKCPVCGVWVDNATHLCGNRAVKATRRKSPLNAPAAAQAKEREA